MFCRLYKVWMARQYPAYYPNTLLLDNALATMGAGVPSAMAAKLVHPEVRGTPLASSLCNGVISCHVENGFMFSCD